jgi:hypothetical protein
MSASVAVEAALIDILSMACMYFLATRLPAPVKEITALPHPDDQAPDTVNWYSTPRSDLWFPEDELEVGRCYEKQSGTDVLELIYSHLDREQDRYYFIILTVMDEHSFLPFEED